MNLLDFVFPKRCVGCGKLGRYFCDRCSSIIRIIELNEAICPICEKPAVDGMTHPRCETRYSLDGLTSFFRYDGVIKKAIKTIKYRFVSDLANEFVALVPEASIISLSKLLNSTSLRPLVIPIPLHPSRLRFRGFNQAAELGKIISLRLQIPMRTDILRRTRSTVPQVEMKHKEERVKNMGNVFAMNTPLRIATNVSVLLFDDVFTTGATMRAAAKELKRNGVKFVWGVTMAR
ncbi:hypothetical protein A2Z00_01295 [Candidatus Gottesmanbacteria bacterium RBG_13_45_10]|uniref:Double zinc ribbon domain-containing protein n=1 Tax=Candidatus Gottesmanbacteria bacterium RBG_13_45_10 TaxID=1798370 RepID=A0A1F5ZHB9_9BACT|nr:MAG: hypothetical protein A2Z00_01295 [Candidatus Gottesmanbacteria bacterium RBG_13_45_10]